MELAVVKTHELKIWPQYYKHVADGSKPWELRKNDRNFKEGQLVELREWDPETQLFTDSPVLKFKIGYIHPLNRQGMVIFGLLSALEL